ncbi:MAG: DNA mismatch repair protein MutS [Chitinophagaceae bacterium]|nr:DNA mismatch repair protein MutS [Chitinophagaceae bacterium]MCE2758894.1 DNA mismatch repair protein MutS [Chitinophagaceae bacterium]
MRFYPESAPIQLEFDKIKALLVEQTQTLIGKDKAESLRIHTRKEFIETELRQTYQYAQLLAMGQTFQHGTVFNLQKEVKLLSIPGAVLTGEVFLQFKSLADNIESIFRWFDDERIDRYSSLFAILSATHIEKSISTSIQKIIGDDARVMDTASDELSRIRMQLYKKRNEQRRSFERILSKLQKSGYIADIEESFLNGRRVLAIYAEHKRIVKGILHGESDSRRTSFIEPEETIDINNDIYSLENDEKDEEYRILKQLTSQLSVHAPLLKQYMEIIGEFDFVRAKAKLAQMMDGHLPHVTENAEVKLVKATHPLLLLYNKKSGKKVVPLDLYLNDKQRILVISGPNAGGKTVCLKTTGLLQLMVQSGLLIPAHPESTFGIFKQLMIHIGDTQSIEFELSTYSAHLKNMKYFMEEANGRTMFFIDELGSGSDPSLGGAFAEVFLEQLIKKHAFGIVTTHYLNLKVMASKTPGIVNGAMAFDEKHLLPEYKLNIGKPGSSYTFSIAERIGLSVQLIERAKSLVNEHHFTLDKLLNKTEQELRNLENKEKELQKLIKENEVQRKKLHEELNREKHRQQVELLKEQNKIAEDKLVYLKDMERKLKQVVFDWKRMDAEEDKKQLIKNLQALLFNQKEKQVKEKAKKKIDSNFILLAKRPAVGDHVMMKQNNKIAVLSELRGKKAFVTLGSMQLQVNYEDLVAVKKKPEAIQETSKSS